MTAAGNAGVTQGLPFCDDSRRARLMLALLCPWLDRQGGGRLLSAGMAILRVILLTLLMLAALPWGAYAAGRLPPVAARPDAPLPLVLAGQGAQAAARPHRCRGLMLPGSPCFAELLAQPAGQALPPRAQGRALHLHRQPPLQGGIIVPVRKRPPRLG